MIEARIIVGESLPEEFHRNAIAGIERHNWDMLALIAAALALALLIGRKT